ERNERIDDRSNRRNREDADYWGEMTEVRQLPRNVHFAAIYAAAPLTDDTRLPRVIYYPDGSATATTIAIQDTGRRSISVEVYRTTGMARVEKGLPPEEPRLQTIYYGPGDRKLIREVD
ncbi:MAG: hypothetical protein M1457_03925, partial [bacterium]|nr:hypothetical protein [bacterium]